MAQPTAKPKATSPSRNAANAAGQDSSGSSGPAKDDKKLRPQPSGADGVFPTGRLPGQGQGRRRGASLIGSQLSSPNAGQPPPTATSGTPPNPSPRPSSAQNDRVSMPAPPSPSVGVLHRRTRHYVNIKWGTVDGQVAMTDKTYVETLKPQQRKFNTPIILLHGDHHTGDVRPPEPHQHPIL